MFYMSGASLEPVLAGFGPRVIAIHNAKDLERKESKKIGML